MPIRLVCFDLGGVLVKICRSWSDGCRAAGLDVRIDDISTEVAALALQGARSRDVLEALTDASWADLRYFRRRATTIAGIDVDVTRTGYTGDLGYELWVDAANALALWDAVFAAGRAFGIRPVGTFALDVLRRRGHAETTLDLGDLALRNLERFRERPDFIKGMRLPEPAESSLLCGEAGILLVAWRLAPSAQLADDLHAAVRANVANDVDEVDVVGDLHDRHAVARRGLDEVGQRIVEPAAVGDE